MGERLERLRDANRRMAEANNVLARVDANANQSHPAQRLKKFRVP